MVETVERVDVIIIGGGVSGIGAACQLRMKLPNLTFVILESRPRLGGTWDFYKFPGVRTDSDMYTMAYYFKPWKDNKTTASGSAVNDYIAEAAKDYDIVKHIRFNSSARKAKWSSADSRWTVDVQDNNGSWSHITGSFIFMCAGYTNFNQVHNPELKDIERFQGKVAHPQTWPTDLDYKDKEVVVIGSGATAITIVPALAKTAKHVTMLQRSPTYIYQTPNLDPVAALCARYLPTWMGNRIMRVKNTFEQQLAYIAAVWAPQLVQWLLLYDLRRKLRGLPSFERHFTPRYPVLTQRLCLSPDSDFTNAITEQGATVVTDTIERFTPSGILLTSGQELSADVVVTATGFDLYALGGVEIEVDGVLVEDAVRSCFYKGESHAEPFFRCNFLCDSYLRSCARGVCCVSIVSRSKFTVPTAACLTSTTAGALMCGIPNMVVALGYLTASWTLRIDMIWAYACRLLAYMQAHQYTTFWAKPPPPEMPLRSVFAIFNSSYLNRGADRFFHQGTAYPYRVNTSYYWDYWTFHYAALHDQWIDIK